MPLALARYAFTADDWDEVQSFDCGQKPHQKEVSDWLKGTAEQDSALRAISQDPPARVWLYRLEDDEEETAEPGPLVGFGAIGYSQWRWTGKKDPYVPLTMLIWFAVHNDFKRQPPGDEGAFYSCQILDDLVAEAWEERQERPILGLCVHTANQGAIDLYRRRQFAVELAPFKDKVTNVEYLRMARILDLQRLLVLAPHFQQSGKST